MTSLFRRLTWWVHRRRKEDELREELEFHLANEADERQADGLTEDQARWAARRDLGNALELRVHPALVPRASVLANVGGVLNAIALEGRALGPCLLSGRGAGDMPTAVSVVADPLPAIRNTPTCSRERSATM